jgi:hypothetical protein
VTVRRFRCLHTALAVGLLICTAGCATTVLTTPDVPRGATGSCTIRAPMSYGGKPDYLPRAIAAEPVAAQATFLRYTYDTQYDAKQAVTLLQVVNPLLIVGFPTGSNSGTITGLLEVVREGRTIRSYGAACNMKRSSTVFSEGETLTDMRRRGLLLVGANISAQICQDQQMLQTLLGSDQR